MLIHITTKERRSFAVNAVSNITADQNMEVIIQPHIEKKSDAQRNIFHALIRDLREGTSFTEREVKDLVKKQVLGTKLVQIGSSWAEVICSSEVDDEGKPRTKPDYSVLIEGVYAIAGEAGIALGDH